MKTDFSVEKPSRPWD